MYVKYSDQINLNYLRVFNELYITRSTTGAAAKLGISQSAVSQILSKLREATGDPLFIKGQGHLVPTVRATTIGEGLAAELMLLEKKLYPDEFFNQADFDGEITFAISSPLIDIISKPLVEISSKILPKARISFVHWNDHTLNQIINGDVHIGFNLFPLNAPKEIRQIPIRESKPIFVSRTENKWIEEGMENSGFKDHVFAGVILSGINRIKGILENTDLMEGFRFKYRSESQSILANHLLTDNSVILVDELSSHHYEEYYCYQAPQRLNKLLPTSLSYAIYYLQANHQHPIYSDAERVVRNILDELLANIKIIPNQNRY